MFIQTFEVPEAFSSKEKKTQLSLPPHSESPERPQISFLQGYKGGVAKAPHLTAWIILVQLFCHV